MSWCFPHDFRSFRGRSALLFNRYVSGDFGKELLDLYMQKLAGFPQLQLPGLSKQFFTVTLLVMGECWRRFIFERQRCPWDFISSLLEARTLDTFFEVLRKYQNLAERCKRCVDIEFTTSLLSFIPAGIDKEEALLRASQLQKFISNLAVYAPLSADVVECLHGFFQAKVHRFRGSKPSDSAAQQLTLWSTVTSSYGCFRDKMWSALGDAQAFRRCAAWERHPNARASVHAGQGRDGGGMEEEQTHIERRTHHFRLEDLNKSFQEGAIPQKKLKRLCGNSVAKRRFFKKNVRCDLALD